MEPNTPIHHQLSRNKRLQIQTLRAFAKLSYKDITRRLGVTLHQVQLACQSNHPTPKKRPRRPLLLNKEQIQQLIEFITSSKYARRLGYAELAQSLNFNYSKLAIKAALNSQGYYQYLTRKKPPLSNINKTKHLNWALEHRH
jgi:transposase